MNKIETNLKDCYILEPKRFGDDRGHFSSITKEELQKVLEIKLFDKIMVMPNDIAIFNDIAQISNSKSIKGVVRGLHFQKDPYCQAKVVKCNKGGVLDVVVDMRKDSPTYGKSTAVELTPENGRCLYVPRGFAHGFVALTDDTLFEYYVDNKYMPRLEGGILWNDPKLDIDWDGIFKKYGITKPILSDKDINRETLEESTVEFYRKPKRHLITGFKGQLGYDIVRELEKRGEHEYLALDIDEMDITNREEVMKIVKAYNPDVIYHCAAWTAVDKAEDMEDKVTAINVEGTKNLTDASIEVGAKMIYMSTDYVFDGKKEGLYTEEDEVNPMSVYGKTKYLGEEEVRRNPKHFITRISWVFGINGNNFINAMLKKSNEKEELPVVDDQVGSPTYTVDLAKLLVEMAYTDKYGTYHVNNNGYCSWAEFAEYIFKISNRDTKVNKVSTEEYIEETQAKQAYRPRNSKLDKTKLTEAGFEMLPDWMDATERYYKELYNNPNKRFFLGLDKGE